MSISEQELITYFTENEDQMLYTIGNRVGHDQNGSSPSLPVKNTTSGTITAYLGDEQFKTRFTHVTMMEPDGSGLPAQDYAFMNSSHYQMTSIENIERELPPVTSLDKLAKTVYDAYGKADPNKKRAV